MQVRYANATLKDFWLHCSLPLEATSSLKIEIWTFKSKCLALWPKSLKMFQKLWGLFSFNRWRSIYWIKEKWLRQLYENFQNISPSKENNCFDNYLQKYRKTFVSKFFGLLIINETFCFYVVLHICFNLNIKTRFHHNHNLINKFIEMTLKIWINSCSFWTNVWHSGHSAADA